MGFSYARQPFVQREQGTRPSAHRVRSVQLLDVHHGLLYCTTAENYLFYLHEPKPTLTDRTVFTPPIMNTKSSSLAGWIAYTLAFAVGGYIGIDRYWNGPGGRKEREAEADRKDQEREAMEKEYEDRVRRERAEMKRRAMEAKADNANK